MPPPPPSTRLFHAIVIVGVATTTSCGARSGLREYHDAGAPDVEPSEVIDLEGGFILDSGTSFDTNIAIDTMVDTGDAGETDTWRHVITK